MRIQIAMLFLLFQLGHDRYAIETGQIVEVLPLVRWKAIPQAPPGVAGVFNYHGAPVPLIDLGELALGKPSRALMSTRIIVVKYAAQAAEPPTPGTAGETHLLGLLAEQATLTLRCSAADFSDPGLASDTAPYLGPVITDAKGIIQRVDVRHLLPANVQELLFRQSLEPV